MPKLHLDVRMLLSTAVSLLLVNTVFTTIRATHQGIYYDDSSLWHRNVIETYRGKLWCLILADVQVVSVAAPFWESDAHCFVGELV